MFASIDEAGPTSRSSTRLVTSVLAVPSPSGLAANSFNLTSSSTTSPEVLNGEKGINGEQNGQETANGASRKRVREPTPAVEVLTSSRRR